MSATQRTAEETKMTAYHEAAHAVAADDLRCMFGGVTIIPDLDEGTSGTAEIDDIGEFLVPRGMDPASPECDQLYLEWAENAAVVLYAGHAAVVSILGQSDMSDEGGASCGALSDFEKARVHLDNDPQRMARAKERAVEIVNRRRDHVEAVAHALLENGELDWDSVQRIMGDIDDPEGATICFLPLPGGSRR